MIATLFLFAFPFSLAIWSDHVTQFWLMSYKGTFTRDLWDIVPSWWELAASSAHPALDEVVWRYNGWSYSSYLAIMRQKSTDIWEGNKLTNAERKQRKGPKQRKGLNSWHCWDTGSKSASDTWIRLDWPGQSSYNADSNFSRSAVARGSIVPTHAQVIQITTWIANSTQNLILWIIKCGFIF